MIEKGLISHLNFNHYTLRGLLNEIETNLQFGTEVNLII